MTEKKKVRDNIAAFAKTKSRNIWSTNRQITSSLGGAGGYRTQSRDKLSERIANAKTPDELTKISIEAKSNQGYSDVINYYKSMYYYRYLVTPVNSTTKKSGKVLEITNEMLNIVETINFEAILPHILETGLYEGRVTLYIEKHKDGLVTHVLPNTHSQPLLRSSYGTDTVIFDLEYFDDLLDTLGSDDSSDVLNEKRSDKKGKREDERAALTMAILSYFPKELVTAYLLYAGLSKQGKKESVKAADRGPRMIALKPENAAIIPFSPSSAPPKINVAAAEENYKEVLEVQNRKSKAGLEKIFTHKIPIGPDGDLLLTVDEAADIQNAMEQYLGENAEITVITTIGDTALHDVQKEQNEKNRAVAEAFENQYDAAAINPHLFRADTDYALGVSLNRDASFMWDILQKVMNFYNIVVNDVFNFGEYTCQIKLLPITVYNEEARVNEYRKSAEYGIGKLEAIVATGQKQVSLLDKLDLELALNLDELLTPLQSSHTRSSKDQEPEKEVVKKDETDKKEADTQKDDAEEVKDEEKD